MDFLFILRSFCSVRQHILINPSVIMHVLSLIIDPHPHVVGVSVYTVVWFSTAR